MMRFAMMNVVPVGAIPMELKPKPAPFGFSFPKPVDPGPEFKFPPMSNLPYSLYSESPMAPAPADLED